MSFLFPRPITKLTLEKRAPNPGRHGLAIALIVRNEARHIGEWARFHHLAGVRHFYVYDNGSHDGTAEVLRHTLPGDALTITPWNQRLTDTLRRAEIHNQVLAYAHAVLNYGADYDWFATIDCDEFLIPGHARDLPSALAPYAGQAVLTLPWHNFGRCGHVDIPAGGVLENYLLRQRDASQTPKLQREKCIFDPMAVSAVSVHMMTARDGTPPREIPADLLQLNHYYTRSDAELKAKMARGPNVKSRAKNHDRRVMRRVEAIEADTCEDRSALEYLARIGQTVPLG